jgi:hypothetical protein
MTTPSPAQQLQGETLKNALVAADYVPRSYSGRGMYGRTCLGVTISRYQSETQMALDVMETASGSAERKLLQLAMRGAKRDDMGLGQIIYWPDLPWVENEEGEW